MNRKRGVIVFGVVVALLAGAIVLLATGGEPRDSVRDLVVTDPVGDLELTKNAPAEEVVLADIRKAEARVEGNQVIFEARLGAPVPEQLDEGELELRWDIESGSGDEWTLSGVIGRSAEVDLIGLAARFGASTRDDTFPGFLGTAGDAFTVLLKANKVSGFPLDFTWKLTATISRGPAIATDVAPDEGVGESINEP